MATAANAKPKHSISVSGCSVTNTGAPFNEHARDAVIALAKAAEANAVAIQALAESLHGMGNASMMTGISVDGSS